MELVMCREVVVSTKAYLTIATETLARVSTETGGILLGKRAGDVWYVIEAIDAGMQAVFRTAFFEYDTPYVNHLANHVARLYENHLELLGLWHRHPGSMDTFSSTDDATNQKYAAQNPQGSVSGLVNLDPDFRLTMYHVALPLRYTRVRVGWGDEHIPRRFLALKKVDDVLVKLNRRQDRLPLPLPDSSSPVHPPSASGNSAINAFTGSIREGIRAFGQSWAHRRPAASNSTPLTINLTDAAHPGPAAQSIPPEDQATALDMLEQELDYIENQRDYKCTMRVENGTVIVDMEYLHAMPYFPQRIECVLGSHPDGQQYIKINRQEMPYARGAIRAYVDQAVRSAMEGRPSV